MYSVSVKVTEYLVLLYSLTSYIFSFNFLNWKSVIIKIKILQVFCFLF